MKSAFELAMERLGGNSRQYTEEQKAQFNEIDREFDARLAQIKLQAQSDRLKVADDAAKLKEFEDQLAEDIRQLEAKREDKKESLRREFAK